MTLLIVTTHAAGPDLEALRVLAAEAGGELRVATCAADVAGLAEGTQVAAGHCAPEVSAELRAQASARQIQMGTTYHLGRLLALRRARAGA